MRKGNLLFSAVHLFVVLLVLMLGALFLLLPQAPQYRAQLANLLLNNPDILTHIGFIALLIGFVLFIGFYYINRKNYYEIRIKNSQISMSDHLIKEVVMECWKKLYPEEELPQEILLSKQGEIEIFLQSKQTIKHQEVFLKKVRDQLLPLLSYRVGYKSPSLKLTLLLDSP